MEEIPKGFDKARQQAEHLISDNERLNQLLQDALRKAQKNKRNLEKMWEEILLLIQFVKAYVRGEYTSVPWSVIVYMVAAIIYFVNPFDLIPDFLFGIGFLDDATVIAFVVRAIHNEIERFKSYQHAKTF